MGEDLGSEERRQGWRFRTRGRVMRMETRTGGREGGNNGTDDINSRILQYGNRQFANIGTMREENWIIGNQPGHITE